MSEARKDYKGKTVRIKEGVQHPQIPDFGGSEFRVEDYWDAMPGNESWMFADGNPACLVYAMRSAFAGIPTDNEVLYGKVGAFGHLVHVSEIYEFPGGAEG
jgi:hypothetical protein